MNYENFEEVNADLRELWIDQHHNNRNCQAIIKKPMQYPEMSPQKKLLFIGLNPSFNEAYITAALDQIPGNILGLNDFSFDGNDFESNPFVLFENHARENHSYFMSMSEFGDYITQGPNNWNHIDLLAIRETKQQSVKDMFKVDVDFFETQIKIALEIVRYLDPKMIIITNAFAREILDNCLLDYSNHYHNLYRFLPNAQIPVYSIGSLSGQRQLDKGTREILRRVLRTEWERL